MYIFGTCTPRSGSQSLSGFLKHQFEINSKHESFLVDWKLNDEAFENIKNSLYKLKKSSEEEIFAEINFSLIPYCEKLISEFSDAKFIFLKRDKESTLKSFKKNYLENFKLNNLTDINSEAWKNYQDFNQDITANCFPKYNLDYEKAFFKYWEQSNKLIDIFIEKYPENSILFEDFSLQNSIAEQKRLIKFLGLEEKTANFFYKYYADNLNETDVIKSFLFANLKIDLNTETSINETVYKNMNIVHDELTGIAYQYEGQKTLFYRSRIYNFLMELNLETFFDSNYHLISQSINNIYEKPNSIFNSQQSEAKVLDFIKLYKKLIEETSEVITKFNNLNEKENNISLLNSNTQYDNAIYLIFDNLVRLELNMKYILANYSLFDEERRIKQQFPLDAESYLRPTDQFINSIKAFELIPSVLRIVRVKSENLKNIKPQLVNALQILTRKFNEHHNTEKIKDYYQNLIKEIMQDLIELS